MTADLLDMSLETTATCALADNQASQTCLDLLRVSWRALSGELSETFATLLQVSESDGLLHVDEPVSTGTELQIHLGDSRCVSATVESSEHDEFGYYLYFRTGLAWFPVEYQPAYLLPN